MSQEIYAALKGVRNCAPALCLSVFFLHSWGPGTLSFIRVIWNGPMRCLRTLDKTQPPKELQSFPSPSLPPWLPDGYSQIFRSGVFGPSGFWTMAPLRYAAKFDPFLSLDCAPHPPPWHNPRKGRDQILPSGNLGCDSTTVTESDWVCTYTYIILVIHCRSMKRGISVSTWFIDLPTLHKPNWNS